jgi:hypothetical protein
MLTSGLDSALSQPPRPETVLACAGRFIEQLKDHAFLPQLGPAYREEVRKFCQPDALRQKLEHELGDNPFPCAALTTVNRSLKAGVLGRRGACHPSQCGTASLLRNNREPAGREY